MFKRLFLGIQPSQTTRQEILNLAKKETSHLVESSEFRWILIENLHITTLFLGKTSTHLIPKLIQSVQQVCNETYCFQIHLKDYKVTQNKKSKAMLWKEVLESDETPLTTLHEKLRNIANKTGLPTENRSYRPHMTLGKFKTQELQSPQITKASISIPLQIESLVLFESDLKESGVSYRKLEIFPFN